MSKTAIVTRVSPLKILGLKIDVDTYRGMRDGVPQLLSILRRFDIKASFYLSIGPDTSGIALKRLLSNPRFLSKMFKSDAVRLYGIKTALYGTLLPAPLIALSFPHIVKEILEAKHDVEFHAWDHRRWQDDLSKKEKIWIENWFSNGLAGFEKLVGKKPAAFGAPGWVLDERVLEIIPSFGFQYLSCTRASAPFIYESNGLLEVPSNLPCLEEIGIRDGAAFILSRLSKEGIYVLPVHAEVEGTVAEQQFGELLRGALALGYEIKTVDEIAKMLAGELSMLPRRNFNMELLPGRAFPCAV